MRQTLTTLVVVIGMAITAVTSFGADTVGNVTEVTAADRFDFAPDGTIHIDGSYGLLNIEGWDKQEVEFTVTRSRPLRFGQSGNAEQDKARIGSIQVKTEHKSSTDLTITTTLLSRHGDWAPFLPADTTNDVNADYEVHVPRDSRLVIRHGVGLVQVRGVTGEIEASARSGDLLLWLPPGSYSIDAQTKLGIVSSELEGTGHNRFLVGERFTREAPVPSRRLLLRMGFGGITIRQIPSETDLLSAAAAR